MRKLSIRLRLTLYIVLLLIGICAILTLISVYNANQFFVAPYLSSFAVAGDADASIAVEAAELDAQEVDGTMAMAITTPAFVMASGISFNESSIWAMAAVIGGGGLLAYFLLGRALRPLGKLSGEISAVTENELSQRLGGFDARDEISSLADSFNIMLGRIDKAFSDQKRFSSDAAHELKTPLAAIKTNIDVLRLEDHPTTEQYEQTINVVGKQTQRMIRLVDDLFRMSSQRNYGFDDEVQFDEMFRDIIAQLAPRIEEKKLSVQLKESGFKTMANSVMLMRAFSNLVENAVKYNVEGGSLGLSARADKNHYIFTVQDTGIGIPKEKQPHIFKPFYRGDDSRSRKAGGAGLGLAIAKDIIERHGGAISVASGASDGTVFTVTLPVIPVRS